MGKKQSSSFWHSRRRSASAPATPRAAAEPPLGCMSMVHYLIFAPGAGCVGRPPSSSHAAVVAPPNNYHQQHGDVHDDKEKKRGGFEAPRNSLELDADNLNDIPIGVQIEPVFDALLACRKMRANKATAPSSSEAETPRTPSLVARLMGIDGLPAENQSPSPAQQVKRQVKQRSSSRKEKEKPLASSKSEEKKKRVIPESVKVNRREPLGSLQSCNVARSLPETPRGSWEGARLSLQALKENVLDRAAQYMSLPSSPTSAAAAGANKNKKKQKKQDAGGGGRRARREDNKETNQERTTAKEIIRQAKENVASRKAAQRQSAAAHNNKENVSPVPVRKDKLLAVVAQAGGGNRPSPPPRAPLAPKHPPPPPPPQRAKPSLDTPTRARKPDGCERFATRAKKPPHATPGATATTVGCSLSQVSPLEADPEYSYLRTVLERGGFMRTSPPTGLRSRPFPVDPIVFHLLELELELELELPADEARLGPLRHRWNRKLMFHLAQEILADVLLLGLDDAELLSRVWKRVRSFPAADCRVVGDIDALVAADLASASVRRLGDHPAVAEEAGDVADDLADRVLEDLLGECVADAEEEDESSLSLSSGSRWEETSGVA